MPFSCLHHQASRLQQLPAMSLLAVCSLTVCAIPTFWSHTAIDSLGHGGSLEPPDDSTQRRLSQALPGQPGRLPPPKMSSSASAAAAALPRQQPRRPPPRPAPRAVRHLAPKPPARCPDLPAGSTAAFDALMRSGQAVLWADLVWGIRRFGLESECCRGLRALSMRLEDGRVSSRQPCVHLLPPLPDL